MTNILQLNDILSEEEQNNTDQSMYYDIQSFQHLITENTNPKDKLTLFNANARSLIKHKSDFELFLSSLSENTNFEFDILSFTETWANSDLETLVNFDNYTSLFKHKPTTKEGGGIAVYVKNGIQFKVRDDIAFPENSRNMFDGLFLEIIGHNDSGSCCKNSVIGVIYRSPSFPSVQDFNDTLSQLIDKIDLENKNIILTGDINIDLLKSSSNRLTTNYLDMMMSHNLIPSITVPTRITQSTASLIDHIFTNSALEKSVAGTLISDITDHFSNFIFIDMLRQKLTHPKYVTYRKINEKTLRSLNEALDNESWHEVYISNDVNTAYDNFISKYLALINIHLPLKIVRFNKQKHFIQPWMTSGLLKSMKTKEKLYISTLKSRNSVNAHELQRSKYKTYLHVYNKTIKLAKTMYWNDTFEKAKSDIKQTWNNIRYVLNKKSNTKHFPQEFLYNESKLSNEYDIARGFNEFFTNIGPLLANNIKSFPLTASDLLKSRDIPHSFFLEPTTHTEVSKIIDNLKSKTSAGHDNISPKLLKQTSRSVSHPLAHIINLSLEKGIFPTAMKIAKVVPIFKSKDDTLFNNYRPISLLPTFSKIIERLVHTRLSHYLNAHGLLNQSQYGFLKNLSTDQAILELQDRIVKSIASKKWCSGIFLDMSKAFDTLNHDILLSKMFHLGIRGTPLQWFKNYLYARCQYVEYKQKKSENLNVLCGVPQGSILGPLLFLIYINDINDHLNDCSVILFADDTTLLFTDEDLKNVVQNMNTTLDNIYRWLCVNKLSLNIEKTNYIIFHNAQRKLPFKPKVQIDDKEISMVQFTKFLGVYIDNNMNWKKHISIITNKCLKLMSVLCRLKNLLPCSILYTIYKSLFIPTITYGISAWGNSIGKEIKRLKEIQKKTIRIICKAKYNSHTGPIFIKLRTLKLDDFFRLDCCKLFVKSKMLILKPYLRQQIQTNQSIHDHHTRQIHNIHQLNIRSSIQSQLLNYKVSCSWNQLPPSLKNCQSNSIHSFTKKIKAYYISLYPTECVIPNCYICNRNN